MNNNKYQHKSLVFGMSLRSFLSFCLATVMLALTGTPLKAQPKDKPSIDQFKIRNLGSIVNTKDIEYAPTITADGRTLYFVSDRPGGVGGHDFWFTTKATRLERSSPLPSTWGGLINTDLNEGVASIAADGRRSISPAASDRWPRRLRYLRG